GAKKQQEELNNIRKELEYKRKKLKELKDKEGTAVTELQNLEEELDLMEQLIKKLDTRLGNVKIELKRENQQLDSIQVDLEKRRKLLAGRIRGIYKFWRFYQYEAILGSSSVADLLGRLKYLQLIAKQDNELIDEFLKDKEKLEKSKKNLEAKKNELYGLKKEKENEEKSRTLEKQKKEKVLNKIKSEKKAYLRAVKELEESARKIEAFLTKYEEERKKEESEQDMFKLLKGRLDWPVKGEVISNFGEQVHPIFKTVTFNQGIDIQANPGTEVKAVEEGKVIYSSYLRGRGKFLILQHEYGYYTIYADLGYVLVDEGEEVTKGQAIARVGELSLFLGFGLHFELRKGKKQLDPLEWLKE
ncbi:MAG: peptidoglycan DD-metalloendopeptidase family protein, partial [candidate division Zixibacteria bacterium]|nr:peptidoglycan DD-metalloendopeptidase family protein [candidate division Zixibacteria bacterium]